MNPWESVNGEGNLRNNTTSADSVDSTIGFEDNFQPSVSDTLPDSREYLDRLENKLRRIKEDPNVLRQLVERREACMQHLLGDSVNPRTEADLSLDEPVSELGSATQEIVRLIRPEQPLSVGEIVHLIKHDQLSEIDENTGSKGATETKAGGDQEGDDTSDGASSR